MFGLNFDASMLRGQLHQLCQSISQAVQPCRIGRQVRFPERQAAYLIRQVLEATAYLHTQGKFPLCTVSASRYRT